MDDLDRIIPQALNQHIFDKIWNEPLSEYRENIHPMLLTPRSVTGSLSLLAESLTLPSSTTPYFVYGVADSDVCVNFRFPANKWISTDELCNEYRIMIHMYSFRGTLFAKGQVHFRYTPDRKHIYIAVSKSMTSKFMTPSDMTNVYFTVYFDSDTANTIKISSFHMPSYDPMNAYRNRVMQAYNDITDLDTVMLCVNGYEIKGNVYEPKVGDYIDIIVDKNIIGSFTVDLTDSNYNATYYSDKDSCYKFVIHVPKAINPDNKVITHNTCDMIVRCKNPDASGMTRGVYLHRCAKLSVGQITHNDFSIPQYIIDAFRDYLKTQDVVVEVSIRQHEKNNLLIRDKSYIDLLYTHDDKGILYFLLGNTNYPLLSFWNAASLEKSVYLTMMFDVPEVITPANMTYYVDGLGYYHVLSLICERIVNSVITDAFGGSVTYTKPYLYRGKQILPAVYINGKKINNRYILVNEETADTISITLKSSVYYRIGDILTMVMFIDDIDTILSIAPTNTIRAFDMIDKDISIYEKIDTFIPNKYLGIDKQSSVRYRDVTDSIGLFEIAKIEGKWMILCGDAMENKQYVILKNVCSYRWDVDIDQMVAAGANIAIDLSRPVRGRYAVPVPILNFKNESIYLNGKYLIRGLDYVINRVTSIEGDVSFIQLVVQSFEYLLESGNNVEIFLNVAEIEDFSTGFVIEDKVYDMTPANLWFPSISACHIYGELEYDAINRGIYIQLPEGKYPNGKPFEVQTAVPKIARDFIDRFHSNDDKARLEILNDYFYGKAPAGRGIIRIPGSHRVYSTFINKVIRDIVFEGREFADDPDLERLKDQLVDYDYLRPYDLVMTQDLNLDLVDIYPAYQQYITDSTDKIKLIKKIISAYLPRDQVTAGGDYYG